MLADGAPVTAVADHIGDTIETMTQVYAHWLWDEENVAALVLERVLGDGTFHGTTSPNGARSAVMQ